MFIHDNYKKWNDAIIDYVLDGLNTGDRVFLAIDDEALEAIGCTFEAEQPQDGWSKEFVRTVRRQHVFDCRIRLERPWRDPESRPRFVACLAFMVLAAYSMGEERDDRFIDPRDYFAHFNRRIGLDSQHGRPDGLDYGLDEELWLDWAIWLFEQSFMPTARPGAGAYKNLRYPISQTLLRKSDKDKLWNHFKQFTFRKHYDEALLVLRLQEGARYLTKHVEALLNPTGNMWLTSYDAISSACYEVYQEWCESDGSSSQRTRSGSRLRTSIDAVAYRLEDPITREVDYRVYPRQTTQSRREALTADYLGQMILLVEDRPGWYTPLRQPLSSSVFSKGIEITIHSTDSALRSLKFPARDFWVLTLDPDSPNSGVYANWDTRVELGAEFILLAREQLRQDITTLNHRNMLEWREQISVFEGWDEYRGVTIVSGPEAWSGIDLVHDDLLSLRPHISIGVNLIGGLRAPGRLAWFVGYPPKLSLASPDADAVLSIYDEYNNQIQSCNVSAGSPELAELQLTERGIYRLVVEQRGQEVPRMIRMVSWDDVEAKGVDFEHISQDHRLSIYGTRVAGKSYEQVDADAL